MPVGVEVDIDGDMATIAFIDPSLRGPALGRLLAAGGPASIETLTREGTRVRYRVPVRNASAAGLIDQPVEPSNPPLARSRRRNEARSRRDSP